MKPRKIVREEGILQNKNQVRAEDKTQMSKTEKWYEASSEPKLRNGR